jgi:hypothetical protein
MGSINKIIIEGNYIGREEVTMIIGLHEQRMVLSSEEPYSGSRITYILYHLFF